MKTNPTIIFRKEFDRTGILFNPDNGDTFGLNPTSALIWECLEKSMDKPEILATMAQHVNALPPSAVDDLDEFIVQLQRKGFLS